MHDTYTSSIMLELLQERWLGLGYSFWMAHIYTLLFIKTCPYCRRPRACKQNVDKNQPVVTTHAQQVCAGDGLPLECKEFNYGCYGLTSGQTGQQVVKSVFNMWCLPKSWQWLCGSFCSEIVAFAVRFLLLLWFFCFYFCCDICGPPFYWTSAGK